MCEICTFRGWRQIRSHRVVVFIVIVQIDIHNVRPSRSTEDLGCLGRIFSAFFDVVDCSSDAGWRQSNFAADNGNLRLVCFWRHRWVGSHILICRRQIVFLLFGGIVDLAARFLFADGMSTLLEQIIGARVVVVAPLSLLSFADGTLQSMFFWR